MATAQYLTECKFHFVISGSRVKITNFLHFHKPVFMNDKRYYKLCFSVLRDECSLSVNLSGEWRKCRLECAHFVCGVLTKVAWDIVMYQLARNVRLWPPWIPFICYFVHEARLLQIHIFRFNITISTSFVRKILRLI